MVFPIITLSFTPNSRAESLIIAIKEPIQTDFSSLKNALNTFFKSSRFQVISEMTLKAKVEQSNVEIVSKNKTTTALPNQFRSEIEMSNRKYLVVSNGKQVWVYKPSANEYAVSSFDDFQSSQDNFLIGLSSSFLLEIARSLQEEQKTSTINQADLVDSITDFFTNSFNQEGFTFKQEKQTIDQVTYSLYRYRSNEEGIEFVLWIDPKEENLKRLQVLGTEKDIMVDITENILQHTTEPEINNDTFTFIPTPEMKQVQELPLEAF
ncbi:MAG: DUF2092 domain-containing protein [Snowella sp.]|nr:DUF2092 domain-containing protein [Snowella sp.]